MKSLKDEHFKGEGMSEQPFSAKESAQLRQLHNEISDRWPAITGFTKLVDATNVLYTVIKVGGPVGLLMVAAGVLAKSGGYL